MFSLAEGVGKEEPEQSVVARKYKVHLETSTWSRRVARRLGGAGARRRQRQGKGCCYRLCAEHDGTEEIKTVKPSGL